MDYYMHSDSGYVYSADDINSEPDGDISSDCWIALYDYQPSPFSDDPTYAGTFRENGFWRAVVGAKLDGANISDDQSRDKIWVGLAEMEGVSVSKMFGGLYAVDAGDFASVDVEEMVHGSQDMPDMDYTNIRDLTGEEPNAREYWAGYNAACESRKSR